MFGLYTEKPSEVDSKGKKRQILNIKEKKGRDYFLDANNPSVDLIRLAQATLQLTGMKVDKTRSFPIFLKLVQMI